MVEPEVKSEIKGKKGKIPSTNFWSAREKKSIAGDTQRRMQIEGESLSIRADRMDTRGDPVNPRLQRGDKAVLYSLRRLQ